MRLDTFLLYKFSDPTTCCFDVEMYSRFKNGCLRSAHLMGKELANGFFRDRKPFLLNNDKQIVVFASPYFFIPSAAHFMMESFVKYMNLFLVKNNKKPVLISKIMRELTYHNDYGKMGSSERGKLIAQDKFYVDKSFIQGKVTIHLDDVRITGSHELEIDKLINEVDVDSIYIYYAKDLSKNPKNEDYLNNNAITCFHDLFKIINSSRGFLNVRNIRSILTSSDQDFQYFIENYDRVGLFGFYDLCIGNQYHNVEQYKNRLDRISSVLNTRSLKNQSVHL